MTEPTKPYRTNLIAAAIVLAAAIYLSSGTMAPYGATLAYPLVLEPCHYLVNSDHYHYDAVFRMIRGEDVSRWAGSAFLRRILFPVMATPFVMTAGLLAGGLIASILLNVAALLAFADFVRKRVGVSAAIWTAWLIATYPGITYWAGLPYANSAIVPGSLFGLILLYRIDEGEGRADAVRAAFLLGVIFLAYDLFAFFGPATVLMLAWRKRWGALAPAVFAMIAPGALVGLMFVAINVSVINANSGVYLSVIFAWLNPDRYNAEWFAYLRELPVLLVSNAIYGNMIFLPLLAIGGASVLWRRKLAAIALPEKVLLVTGLMLFLFTNAAPPYYGWQVRGAYLARLYQPLVVVLLMIAARATQNIDHGAFAKWRAALVATLVLNASVAFGPVLMNPLAAFTYHKFYVHSPPESLLINLERYGRRPLGFCSASHEWDWIRDPNTPLNRPPFMYRYPPR